MEWRWLVDFRQASGPEPFSECLRSYQNEAAKDKTKEDGDQLTAPKPCLERFSLGSRTVRSQGLRFNADPGRGHRRILGTRVHSRPIMNDERSSRPPVFDNSKSQSRAGSLRKRFPRTKPTSVSPNEANLGFPERSQPRFPRTKPTSVSPNEANLGFPERSQPRFPRTKPTSVSPNEANVKLGNPRRASVPMRPDQAQNRTSIGSPTKRTEARKLAVDRRADGRAWSRASREPGAVPD